MVRFLQLCVESSKAGSVSYPRCSSLALCLSVLRCRTCIRVGKWMMFSVVLDGSWVMSWFLRHTFGRYVVAESLWVVGMPLIP